MVDLIVRIMQTYKSFASRLIMQQPNSIGDTHMHIHQQPFTKTSATLHFGVMQTDERVLSGAHTE